MGPVLFNVHWSSGHLSSLGVVLHDNHYPEAFLSFKFIQLSGGWDNIKLK